MAVETTPDIRALLQALQATAAGQRAMFDELRELIGLLRAQAAGQAVGAAAALVHAIHGAFGECEFSAGELVERAQRADDPGRLLRALTFGMSRRHAGIRLGQVAGRPTAGGLVLVQTSDNRDGAVWQVRVLAVQDSQLMPPGRDPRP